MIRHLQHSNHRHFLLLVLYFISIKKKLLNILFHKIIEKSLIIFSTTEAC